MFGFATENTPRNCRPWARICYGKYSTKIASICIQSSGAHLQRLPAGRFCVLARLGRNVVRYRDVCTMVSRDNFKDGKEQRNNECVIIPHQQWLYPRCTQENILTAASPVLSSTPEKQLCCIPTIPVIIILLFLAYHPATSRSSHLQSFFRAYFHQKFENMCKQTRTLLTNDLLKRASCVS